jgi:hypothetical protein
MPVTVVTVAERRRIARRTAGSEGFRDRYNGEPQCRR